MKKFARIYILLLLVSIPVLFVASWIGSIYDSNIHNLLDADGVRWGVSHIMQNYANLPLPLIIFLLVVVSIVRESGLIGWMLPENHPLMLKQLRAYTYTNLLCLSLLFVFGLLLLIPASPLLNPFGGLKHSPLSQGWFPLLMLLVVLMANIYGYLSGQLTTFSDFVYAHTRLLRKYAVCFITLFVVAQVWGCLDYSNLIPSSPFVDNTIMGVLMILCFVG